MKKKNKFNIFPLKKGEMQVTKKQGNSSIKYSLLQQLYVFVKQIGNKSYNIAADYSFENLSKRIRE